MPPPKRDVQGGAFAREVERVGVGTPLSGIPVRRPEAGHDRAAGRDRVAAEVHVFEQHAARELHRAVEAQEFVGGVRVEAGIVAQSFELRPMVEERECAVADEVDRGLVAGDEQQRHGGQQLIL